MGFRNSCAIFTKLARVLTALWRKRGVKLVHMMDDLLIAVSGTYEEACVVRDAICADLDKLGVEVNWKKSVLTPSFCVRFLGMLVNSEEYRFFVPPDKIEKLRALSDRLLTAPDVTVRELASIAGKVMSLQVAVPAVRMMTRELYGLIRPDGDWDRRVLLTDGVISELISVVGWIQQFNLIGNPIRRFIGMAEVRIHVDAGTGYGWRVDGRDHTAEFEGAMSAVAAQWPGDEVDLFQPWKELLALQYCIQSEGEGLAGRMILVRPDATTTVAYVNKGSGPSVRLTAIMRVIWELCVKWGIALHAEHLGGIRMIATGVDSLSRMSEFSVAPSLFRWLNRLWGFGVRERCEGFTVDLYASKKTAKCSRYASRGGVIGSLGDARTLELTSCENYWVLPPLDTIEAVVMMILDKGVQATIVVPDWANKPWHVLLRSKAKGFEFLKWSEHSPVMWDVAVRSAHHIHLVDKWDFVAFAVGGDESVLPVCSWRGRLPVAKVGRKKRRAVVPELWRPSTQRKRLAAPVLLQSKRDTAGCLRRREGARVLRVLSLCNGCGAASLALKNLGITAEVQVVVVELDEICRRLTQRRFSEETFGWSHDVNDWASTSFMPGMHGDDPWFDLIIAGFPCQDLSEANKSGDGLRGNKSALFFKIWEVVKKFTLVNPDLHFILECTDFRKNHPADFEMVNALVGPAVVMCASRIAPCFRKRAYWMNFKVSILPWDPGATPGSVLEPGRWTDAWKLPTVMASGVTSWNTAEVVFEEQRGANAARVPLLTIEMERAMGMPDDFTCFEGVLEKKRHHMIGNAFQVAVIQHIIREWVVLLQEFDGTLGFQGEGPSQQQKSKRRLAYRQLDKAANACMQQSDCSVKPVVRKEFQGTQRKRAKGNQKKAAWRLCVPAVVQPLPALSLDGIFKERGWGNTSREVLPKRVVSSKRLEVPRGESFLGFVNGVVGDLMVSSRADSTWKAYLAWVEVFMEFVKVFGLETVPSPEVWDSWVQVLLTVVATLSQCYSAGTVSIVVSAVSAFMQDNGMPSPYQSRLFCMVMKGMVRFLGAGKKKKPPVEAWHVAKLVRLEKPERFTRLMHLQSVTVLLVGWELFTRSQDFEEFQVCDFVQLATGMRVLVRYAKNDQKGLTRSAVLELAADPAACPVMTMRQYLGAAGIRVQPGCTKVEGEPQRCTVCPPAFPSITKHQGKKDRAMPKARVTELLRGLFLELARVDPDCISEQEARAFSSKSLRCGGVSESAAQAVRDGVIQGHGGWLQRQSLVHYDIMRPGEQADVSRALNSAVTKWLQL